MRDRTKKTEKNRNKDQQIFGMIDSIDATVDIAQLAQPVDHINRFPLIHKLKQGLFLPKNPLRTLGNP